MSMLPSKDKFIESVKAGKISPVYTEIPFIQPHHAFQIINRPYSFLFESIKGPEKIARYSFLGFDPFLIFEVKNGVVELKTYTQSSLSPLRKLKELFEAYKLEPVEGLPPFYGGAAGFISYEFVHYFERLPKSTLDDLYLPDAHFMFFDTIAAFDHRDKKLWLLSCPGAREIIRASITQSPPPIPLPQVGKIKERVEDWANYYEEACERLNFLKKTIQSAIANPQTIITPKNRGKSKDIKVHHEMGKDKYLDMVKRAKEYIKAGDIFQANLSQRVSAHLWDVTPWQIYTLLREINPSPFAAYLNMCDYYIVSSSPERLLRVKKGLVETRPIAGTRPRGANAEGDIKMRAELLINEKERAEHIMLIDLERNDLGKISDYGSVYVDEFMITEDYSHVIHIVSNIRGNLAVGKDCFDAIRAAFPGGTITGVPKVRCMEIIDELEPVARGPYTGSLGYISFTGEMDLNIIIRSFVIKNNIAYVQVGAGIVADSDPEREYEETLKKAEALIKTLQML